MDWLRLDKMILKENLQILAGALRHPVRFLNFAGTAVSYLVKSSRVGFLPAFIDVEPNNYCNLRCSHCQVTYWNKDKVGLSLQNFQSILRQFPLLLKLKLQGMGEPFLHRDIFALLAEGGGRDLSLKVTTNGTVMTPQIAEKLLSIGRLHLIVSLDGATASVFERIRKGASFDRVCENVRFLTGKRQEKPELCRDFVISAWVVVSRDNIHELEKIALLARDLGFDHVTFQTHLGDWGKSNIRELVSAMAVDAGRLTDAVGRLQNLKAREAYDIRVSFTDVYTRRRKCPWPWMGTYIASNGDVVPCCVLGDSDTVKLGNLFERPFREIWNDRPYREFRQKIASHQLPEFCRTCYESNPDSNSTGCA